MREVRLLITGGGTGGHVAPALAVIQAVRARAEGADWRPVFRYLGSEGGIEKTLAAEAGVEFVGVPTGKLRRARTRLGLLSRENLRDLGRVPLGVGRSLREVRRFRPAAVLATGGYVAVPPVIAAGLSGIPVLIHEQTVQIGLANRINARFAARIALTFDGSAAELPPRQRAKTFVTGNPVRPVVFAGDRARAIFRFGFDPQADILPTGYVTGGAQGAQRINQALEAVLPELLAVCRVIHQCGKAQEAHFQAVREALPPALQRRYWTAGFIGEEIGDVYALADLIVGRSGAGTVTEAAALGLPAVFIPLVPTGGDEQTRNARRSADAGAAVMIPQAELDGPRLVRELGPLLADPERRAAMGAAAKTLARPHAAEDLASALLALAGVLE